MPSTAKTSAIPAWGWAYSGSFAMACLEEPDGGLQITLAASIPQVAAPQIEVVGLTIGDVALPKIGDFVLEKGGAELVGDLDGDLVLELEDVRDGPVVAIGPELGPVGGLDQSGGDPHPVAESTDAALEEVVGADGAAHLARIGVLCP